MKKIKGVTLIELIVSMSIFLIIASIAVGAFIVVSRMRSLTGIMREAQQKSRVAMEIITRHSRQAEKVVISPDGKNLYLYFDIKTTTPRGMRFEITDDNNGNKIQFYNLCTVPITNSDVNCTNWGSSPVDIFGGVYSLDDGQDDLFKKNTGPANPVLEIVFTGVINGITDNPYFNNTMDITTSIPLERVK